VALTDVYPAHVRVGVATDVLLIGCSFPADMQVKLNGTLHPSAFENENRIRLSLTATDTAITGMATITISDASGKVFGTRSLCIQPGEVSWSYFGRGPWHISVEAQLLLLVLLTGAFGSSVYALKSLADYQGDGKLYQTWAKYYLIQPLEGAGIAFLLYLVVRGGFLAGTSLDAKAVNLFGVCAVAGLAGAFSDTAFMKLREVFQVLFNPSDNRGGKIKPAILTPNLPDGKVGQPYQVALGANGGTAPLSWTVTPTLPAGLTLSSDGVLSGTPTAVTPKTPFKFTVTDSSTPALTASVDLTLEIT
jgi:hypothetical protein